ncbi:MAG: hypothetical protein KDA84_19780, partial [Planctomycetaceae bacterium]|nr:hypothetical protein [Planctomycetaceae bacterium]
RTYTWIVELRKHLREWMATDGAELAGNIRTAIWSYWNRLAAIFRNYCEWSKHLNWKQLPEVEEFPTPPLTATQTSSSNPRDGVAEQLLEQADELKQDWQELQSQFPKSRENEKLWNVLRQTQWSAHLLVAAFVRVGAERRRQTKTSQSTLKGFEWLLTLCWSAEKTSEQTKSWKEFWGSLA